MKITIPIYSLSGGVSRQPDSKRTPFEAQNLDNCFVSLEKSVEKRSGFRVLDNEFGTFDLSFLPLNVDPYFIWYTVDEANRYLLIVDRAAKSATSVLLYVVKLTNDSWSNETPDYQWDAEDPGLDWDGLTAITEGDVRFPIYQLALLQGGLDTIGTKYNTVKARGIMSRYSRAYMTHAEGNAREILKSLQFGTSILVLNTEVYAGFTSGTNGKLVGLSGTETSDPDIEGRAVTYWTAARIKKTKTGRLYPEGTVLNEGEEWDANFTSKQIPVEDYIYGDFDKPWLGQSVANFSEIRFPPDKNDWKAVNKNLDTTPIDDKAKLMLQALYDPNSPLGDEQDGDGKIYHSAAPYLSVDAGYYRIVSFPETETYNGTTVGVGKPYTQRVRTPDACSVIDKRRMPQRILFNGNGFTISPIDWSPRTIGDRETNPGPSPFLTANREARHIKLTALANFRDRLFIAAGDVIFSSQLGVLEDMWIKDPSNVTTADPIDIRAASNSYAEITAMIPFNAYLFINTKSNVQFELKGDSNLISPLTAEVSATTFYSTAELVDPINLGSNIYFWDRGRLYIYLNQDSREFNTAFDLSLGIQGYLPNRFQSIAVATANNQLIAVDEDHKNHLYFYGSRFMGNEVRQSAFWRYILAESESLLSINTYKTKLYAVTRRQTTNATAWYLLVHDLEDYDNPKLDNFSDITITTENATAQGMVSTLFVPYVIDTTSDTYVILEEDWDDLAGSIFKVVSTAVVGGGTEITIAGINLTQHVGKTVFVGCSYLMNIELSKQYYRQGDGNIVEGVVNLKTLHIRHNDTGNYRVEVTRRGRPLPLISEFSATNLETTEYREGNGTFVAKVFGFSDETVIRLLSDSVTPCNITQLEFRGTFNKKSKSLR
jgi:hypothetical protein